MNLPWQNPCPHPSRRNKLLRGFTLIETLLTLVAIGLAVLVALSLLHRVRQQAKCRQWESELKELSSAFTDFRAKRGFWPQEVGELGTKFANSSWSRGSPFGGDYGWKPPTATNQTALIALTAFHPRFPLSLSRSDLFEIDRHIDDGNLSTGRFRIGFNGWPVYEVGKNP